MIKLKSKIKFLTSPRLSLAKGTRFTSTVFITISLLIAAGVIIGANMYYDIDTSTVMVEEKQQVTGLFIATTTQITADTNSAVLTVTQEGSGYAAIITGGSVGIATSTPRFDFDVWGDAGFGTTTETNVPVLYVDSGNGRVGIATTTPSQAFTIQGDIFGSGNIVLYGDATSTFSAPIETTGFKMTAGTPTTDGYVLTATDTSGNVAWESIPTGVWTDNGTYIFPNNLDRYVGIATSTPRYDLDVWGNAGFGTTSDFNTPVLLVDSYSGRVGIATSTPSAELAVTGDIIGSGNIVLYGNATSTFEGGIETTSFKMTESPSSGYVLTSDSSGYATWQLVATGGGWTDDGAIVRLTDVTDDVGIGTSTPRFKLDVVGNVGFGTTTDYNIPVLYVDSGNGRVGISTTTPASELGIQGDITVQGNVLPQSDLGGYTLGDSSTYWSYLYVATTTIGTSGSNLTIDVDDIRAPGALTIYSDGGALTLQPVSGSNVEVVLGSDGLFRVGSSGQFYIDASGNATTSGTFHAASITVDDATIRKSGDQIIRGVVPIFGFDLPARCNTSCTGKWATTTRWIENTDFFPPEYDGTSRKYRFSIRYDDTTTTASSIWQVATSSDNSSIQFTLLPTDTSDEIGKGYATTTDTIDNLPTEAWALRVKEGENGGYDFQVYEILLIGLDQVD